MSFRGCLTFAITLTNLIITSLSNDNSSPDHPETDQSGEESGFLSIELITSLLFIVHLVAILIFIISHCRKSENLTIEEDKSNKTSEKLKQQWFDTKSRFKLSFLTPISQLILSLNIYHNPRLLWSKLEGLKVKTLIGLTMFRSKKIDRKYFSTTNSFFKKTGGGGGVSSFEWLQRYKVFSLMNQYYGLTLLQYFWKARSFCYEVKSYPCQV